MKFGCKYRPHFSKRELGVLFGLGAAIAILFVHGDDAISSVLKMPKPLPDIVKTYKSVTVYAGRPGMHNTGVRVNEGDYITIIAKGKIDLAGPNDRLRDGDYVRYPDGCLMYRIGKDSFMRIYSSDSSYTNSEKINKNANIYLGYVGSKVDAHGEEYPLERHFYSDDTGYFIVDIVVWKKYDPASVADFLEELSQKDPKNEALRKVAGSSKYQKGIFLQEIKLTQEVIETKKALSTLEAFLERLSQGKGRVIITASDANEVSVEKDELKHGVFTYYLLEGLRGKADFDKDGVVTVDEVYRYVSIKVPQATGQDQHPVKKGEVTGEIVLGVVK